MPRQAVAAILLALVLLAVVSVAVAWAQDSSWASVWMTRAATHIVLPLVIK